MQPAGRLGYPWTFQVDGSAAYGCLSYVSVIYRMQDAFALLDPPRPLLFFFFAFVPASAVRPGWLAGYMQAACPWPLHQSGIPPLWLQGLLVYMLLARLYIHRRDSRQNVLVHPAALLPRFLPSRAGEYGRGGMEGERN